MPRSPLPPPKHRLLLELGRGGMGTVYLALAEGPAGFNKLKVVKQLRPELAAEPHFLQMFLEEARLAARLNHPNIVQTFEVAFDGQRFYLEMEYLEGQSLDAVLRRLRRLSRPLPRAIGLWLVTQVLAGLEYAHELTDMAGKPLHVVHRDVSPHNVFVTDEGAVKLLDFGIAKAADSSIETRSGVVKGKATYMAPEQAGRRAVDRRTDLFSVGVMLWEVLAGKRFWGELSDAEIFVKLEAGVYPSARSVDPSVPESLDAICARMLAKEPDARPATASEVQIALEDWLAASGERAGPRQVAALMTELFAERRAAVRAEIEGQIARRRGPDTVVDVPVALAHNEPSYPTASGRSSAEVIAEFVEKGRASGNVRALESSETTSAATPLGLQRTPTSGRFAAARDEPTLTGSGTASSPPPVRRHVSRARVVAILAAGAVLAGGLAVAVHSRADHDADAKPSVAACTSNHACTAAHAGALQACVDGACVPLGTPTCQLLAEPGEVDRDDTLWLGAMLPITGSIAEGFGKPTLHAVDVARRDFARVSGGLPSLTAGKPARPLAVVACDDGGGSGPALEHLVGELHVPAIIGFGSTKDLLLFAQTTLIPKHVLGIATINTNPLLSSIPTAPGEPRMVWRTIPSYASMVDPIAAVVRELIEPDLRARLPPSDRALRVASLRYGGAGGYGFEALSKTLRFNGKSAAENGNDYRELSIGDPGDPAQAAQAVLPQLVAFAPHVIIAPISEEVLRSLVIPLEDRWPKGESHRPYYLTDGSLDSKSFYSFFHEQPEAQRRFFSINTPASTPENLAFTFRYNEDYAPKVTQFEAPGMGYDAFYLLAYAAYAATTEGQPTTGPALARAIRRLTPPGKRFDVGASAILDAFAVLRQGGSVDLNGTVTTLDFDLATGEPTANFAINCPQRDDAAKTVTSIESGVVYEAESKHLVGTLHCPLVREH